MRDEALGRALRALRHRRGWRQSDASQHARVARSVVSDMEAGRLDGHALGALRRTAAAVGASIRIELVFAGGDVHRLLDADHAALQNHWKQWLERKGWIVHAEATFNHYGERGSIDLLAWRPPDAALVVIEIKTTLVDIQALLASVDRKARVARTLAAERGWTPSATIPALLIVEGTSARRRLTEHAALFGRFSSRGRAALAWLRGDATSAVTPGGLLCLSKLPHAHRDDRRRAGRQRVRTVKRGSRSNESRLAALGRRPVA